MIQTEEIKNLLSKPQVAFWRLEEIQTKRNEFYLCQGSEASEPNQLRSVVINDVFLEVWTEKTETHLGYAKTRLNSMLSLKEQVDKLIKQSELASEQKWKPAPSEPVSPDAKLCAHQFLEDFEEASTRLKLELIKAIDQTHSAEFNSAELFCSISTHRVLAANGFKTEYPQSKIYAEVCFSSSNEDDSQEFMETAWAVRPEDLNFEEMCKRSVEGSRGLLDAKPMPAGQYWTKVKDQDLGQILNGLKNRLSGFSKYQGLPFYAKGSDLIEKFEGQKFEVRVNPKRDFGLNALGFDAFGKKEESLVLVQDNRVVENSYSQKYAQYLGEAANTSNGVLEIQPQGVSQDPDEYLEILQFSGLFVSEISMTFSSEIRLARLVKKDGTVSYLKGGNFSGSFKENFQKAQWSADLSLVGVEGEESVYCPRYAFLNDVSVS